MKYIFVVSFQVSYQLCSYPDERCDDTPQNWRFCQTVCTPTTGTTCVQVHNNGISDAFIPATSQRGNGSNSWRVGSQAVTTIEAFGVNHKEELDPENLVMRGIFRDIFDRTDASVDPVFQINRR